MKKYYLHNGLEEEGPFDIDELKAKNLLKSSQVWYEGLTEWTSADNIEELKGLFNKTTPPPFRKKEEQMPPPLQKTKPPLINSKKPQKKKGIVLKLILTLIVVILIVLGLLYVNSFNNTGSGYGSDSKSYEEKVMTVEEIEQSQPTKFLDANGNYKENFWGDKIKVHGKITNKATVATYKDAKVRITYYSKTKTVLGNNDYTIYEVFPPHSTKTFELKITNYKNVKSIGWEVIDAEIY